MSAKPQRIDGRLYDMEPAVRGFQRFTSEDRANHAASFRLGYLQRQRIGEAFWTHPLRPGVCFPTRIEALRAALSAIAEQSGGAP